MEEYKCPRCSTIYNNDVDSDLWFLSNAGYIGLRCCPECRTAEELAILDKTWKDYTTTLFGAKQ